MRGRMLTEGAAHVTCQYSQRKTFTRKNLPMSALRSGKHREALAHCLRVNRFSAAAPGVTCQQCQK
jgi:hypothetical protein